MEWNAELYRDAHSFVWNHGQSLLSVLDPQSGEDILDVGCGTGELTREIADHGATVTGVDKSAAMIAAAKDRFPGVVFRVEDATALPFEGEFDAVFSNAALHWVREPEAAARSIARALRPGGRFVAECGGFGNVAALERAFSVALRENAGSSFRSPWYFPKLGEYASLLERVGFEVSAASLFDRPTLLAGHNGLRDWYRMFLSDWFDVLDVDTIERVIRTAEKLCEDRYRDGSWTADYRRLRVVARRR
ncbi:MAG: methyltransferase domain-containing protein [Betaproteobacteria bacterium]|nr:methyltransferase domain-containing protein [Betaproteobacteria bacterium]